MFNPRDLTSRPGRDALRALGAAIVIASSSGALAQTTSDYAVVDAAVVATVAEAGLGGTPSTLEPFTVGDAQTYGAYFALQPRQHYEVRIEATFAGGQRTVEQSFDYEHQ